MFCCISEDRSRIYLWRIFYELALSIKVVTIAVNNFVDWQNIRTLSARISFYWPLTLRKASWQLPLFLLTGNFSIVSVSMCDVM